MPAAAPCCGRLWSARVPAQRPWTNASGRSSYLPSVMTARGCSMPAAAQWYARSTVGESPDAVAVDPGTDRVVVANLDDASVSVLDARRGIVLRTVTVGAQPLAVAVDEQTSRTFVVSYGGT